MLAALIKSSKASPINLTSKITAGPSNLDVNLLWTARDLKNGLEVAKESTLGKYYTVPMSVLVPLQVEEMKKDLALSDAADKKTTKALAQGTKMQRENQTLEGCHVAYVERNGFLAVPRFYGEQKFGAAAKKVAVIAEPMKLNMQFQQKLMSSPVPQVQATNAVFEQMNLPILCTPETTALPPTSWKASLYPQQSKGATLVLPCGFGKTICGIYIAWKIGQKTAICVHKGFLVDQWIERIKFCLPDARIGVVQQGKIDVQDKDFVIFMIPSLVKRAYNPQILKGFGLVVVDEAHRLAAECFSLSVPQFECEYRLAITATPNRKDGKSKFIAWTMGPVCFQALRTYEDVRVETTRYHGGSRNEYRIQGWETARDPSKTMIIARMINDLAVDVQRNKMIATMIVKDYFTGHHILALSDRVAQLECVMQLCIEMIKNASPEEPSVGMYFGTKLTKQQRKDAESCRLVFGSNAMAEEGLDMPRKNVLYFLTPRSTIEQACGRVLRTHPEKAFVLIKDIVDTFSCFEGQAAKRRKLYKEWGYVITPQPEVGSKSAPSNVVVVTYAEMARDRSEKKLNKRKAGNALDKDGLGLKKPRRANNATINAAQPDLCLQESSENELESGSESDICAFF